MSFKFHHTDKWACANLDLIEEAEESNKKAIVLIGGASSSGKSFLAKTLVHFLGENGHKAVIVSLDQYNFGLSGIIPNKVNDNYFSGKLKNREEIRARIKKVIYSVPFDKKYAPEQIEKIKKEIAGLIPEKDRNLFLKSLYDEWKVLNFDEPTVYDLKSASEDIKSLYAGKRIKERKYSKVISEQVENDQIINGNNFDVILVEGIYALSMGRLKNFKGIDIITNFIDGNPKSLFLRRIIRDEKATSADSVFTISIYFKYIVKSYRETILPSRKKADIILDNERTFLELREGNRYTTKRELHTKSDKAIEQIRSLGKISRVSYRKDTYFSVSKESRNSNNILRLRSVSHDKGKTYYPSSLVHKGIPKCRKDGKVIRPINILLKEGEVNKVWASAEDCIHDFLSAGFLVSSVQKKKKIRREINGENIVIREVDGQGYFIEFPDCGNEDNYQRIRSLIQHAENGKQSVISLPGKSK